MKRTEGVGNVVGVKLEQEICNLRFLIRHKGNVRRVQSVLMFMYYPLKQEVWDSL